MSNLKISAFDWAALQLFAAKSDVRHYLEGIHIGEKYLSATNGHVLMRIEHGQDVADSVPSTGLIVEPVKVATKRAPTGDNAEITLAFEEYIPTGCTAPSYSVSLSANNAPGLEQKLSIVNATYPDCERVIPARCSRYTTNNYYDANYLELISKAAKLLGKAIDIKAPMTQILGKENSASLVEVYRREDVTMVVMPMRGPKTEKGEG